MSQPDLARLRQLLDQATPRPWHLGCAAFICKVHKPPHPGPAGGCVYTYSGRYNEEHAISAGDINPASTSDDERLVAGMYDFEEGGIVRGEDTALIVEAVNSLPGLLDRLERLEDALHRIASYKPNPWEHARDVLGWEEQE